MRMGWDARLHMMITPSQDQMYATPLADPALRCPLCATRLTRKPSQAAMLPYIAWCNVSKAKPCIVRLLP